MQDRSEILYLRISGPLKQALREEASRERRSLTKQAEVILSRSVSVVPAPPAPPPECTK